MDGILTYRGTIYPWHCDHMGHMNVMWYAGKFDEATWNMLVQIGLTPTYLRDSCRGMGAVEQVTHYKRELMAGDSIEVWTVLREMRERVLRLNHVMINVETGETCATTQLTAVHMDRRTRRATTFGADQRRKGEALLAPAAPVPAEPQPA